MNVSLSDPNDRARPAAPLSRRPVSLLTPGEIRLKHPRVNLGDVRLREPAMEIDLLRSARKGAVASLGNPPVRRIIVLPSRHRLGRRLRWLECFLLVVGLLGVGTWGWFYAEARIFQAYQSWRLDQLVKHRPAELKALLEKYLADVGIGRTKASPPATAIPVPGVPAPAVPAPTPAPPPPLAVGSLIGRIEIPRLALSTIVLEGDSDRILRKAAGHIPGTALPGGTGNVAIAAHRDTFFRALQNIRKDDVISLETPDGDYRYRVDSTHIVAPSDVAVLDPSGSPSLTLVTCYPFYYVGSAPKRYIVRARQIGTTVEPSAVTLPASPQSGARQSLHEAPSEAPGESPWIMRPDRQVRQARLSHPNARRQAASHRIGRSAGRSSPREASKKSGEMDNIATADPSGSPAVAHQRNGLRQRALAAPKRLISWFRSFPKAHSGQ